MEGQCPAIESSQARNLKAHVSVSVCGVVWSCGVDVVECGVLFVSLCVSCPNCVLHPAPLSFPNREVPVRFENIRCVVVRPCFFGGS